MNALRPPARRITSPAPSSSAWTLPSGRSTMSSYPEGEHYGFIPDSYDDPSQVSVSTGLSSSIEFDSDYGPSLSPLYASTRSSAGRLRRSSSAATPTKEPEKTGIPTDVLPRLQVLLKNQLTVFLRDAHCDDMPLESMLHKHSYELAARNEEIIEQVRREGREISSETVHLRYFKGLYRVIRKSQFSGVGGKLWGLWKLETVTSEAYRKPSINPAIYNYPGFSGYNDSGDNDDNMDDNVVDSDTDTYDDDLGMGNHYLSDSDELMSDIGDLEDTDEMPDIDGLEDTDDEDSEEYHPAHSGAGDIGTGFACGPQFKLPSDGSITLLLDLLREFALNRYLLSVYASILERGLEQPDEIADLFAPKNLDKLPAVYALRAKEEYIIYYMHALTFLYKLQLLVQYERKDSKVYWDKDFEYPERDDEPLSLLWSKSMMTMMMTHFHREESESENYWHRHGLSQSHYQQDWAYKLMYITNYLRFAEATVHDWFANPEIRLWKQQERAEEIERRRSRFSEMEGRLMMVPSGKMYASHAKILEWMEEFEKDPVLDFSVNELESKALAGEFFKVVDMKSEWRDEAITLIKRYGGTIHISQRITNESVTTITCPGQGNWLGGGLDHNHVMDFVHSKIVRARFAHTDKEALKNMFFSFRGILPTLTRDDVRELVEMHSGYPDGSLLPEIDYVVVGTRNPADDLADWNRDMKTIEEMGIRKIDEAGFIELLEKSQSWLRNGKRKAPNGSALGEVVKPRPKRRRMWRLSSTPEGTL